MLELTNEDLIDLINKGYKDAYESLIYKNFGICHYILKKYENTGIEYEDLFSVACIGLIKAIKSFDSNKDTKFITYACRCINNEILMCLRKYKNQFIEVSLENHLISIDNGGNGLLLADTLRDISQDSPEELILENTFIMNEFEKFIARIRDERYKAILNMYFLENKSQNEIAMIVELSQSYVSRIIKRYSEKFKNYCVNYNIVENSLEFL